MPNVADAFVVTLVAVLVLASTRLLTMGDFLGFVIGKLIPGARRDRPPT